MGMMDFLKALAVPRPAGSPALESVGGLIADTCRNAGLRVTEQSFLMRSHLQGVVGLFMLAFASLAAIMLFKRRLWPAVVFALLVPAVYLAELEFNWATVSLVLASSGRNIVAEAGPEHAPRELIISAHYDSKTDLFDHEQRKIFFNAGAAGIGLMLAVALGIGTSLLSKNGGPGWLRGMLLGMVLAGTAGVAMLALSLGGGIFRRDPSPGARDNAAAVAILMDLAGEIGRNSRILQNSQVRFVFFSGEEVNMQGSAAYVRKNRPRLQKTAILNLECLGGAGPLQFKESNGTFLRRYPADPGLIGRVQAAAEKQGLQVVPAGFIYDDAARFLEAGIPAVTVSQGHPERPDSYHHAGDNIGRVLPGQMDHARRFIREFIDGYDRLP